MDTMDKRLTTKSVKMWKPISSINSLFLVRKWELDRKNSSVWLSCIRASSQRIYGFSCDMETAKNIQNHKRHTIELSIQH